MQQGCNVGQNGSQRGFDAGFFDLLAAPSLFVVRALHTITQIVVQLSVTLFKRRLKATLERLQRLTETYSEQLLELLPPVANALGAALGVQQHAITTFTEAEIRANVVFQVRMWGNRLESRIGCVGQLCSQCEGQHESSAPATVLSRPRPAHKHTFGAAPLTHTRPLPCLCLLFYSTTGQQADDCAVACVPHSSWQQLLGPPGCWYCCGAAGGT